MTDDPDSKDPDEFERGAAVAEPHVALIGFHLVALGGTPPPGPERAAEFGRFVREELTQAYVKGTIAGTKHWIEATQRSLAEMEKHAPEQLAEMEKRAAGRNPTTAEKCEAILRNIVQRCNADDSEDGGPGSGKRVVAFGPDWGGNSLTLYLGEDHTHVGSSGGDYPFEKLVDRLYDQLLEGKGLSFQIPITQTPSVEETFDELLKRMEQPVVHILSQEDQSYGSERRCCNHCGIRIWSERASRAHVDNWADWRANPNNCSRMTSRVEPQ